MNWSQMTPRERDALVAEKVMGWSFVEVDGQKIWANNLDSFFNTRSSRYSPHYSLSRSGSC